MNMHTESYGAGFIVHFEGRKFEIRRTAFAYLPGELKPAPHPQFVENFHVLGRECRSPEEAFGLIIAELHGRLA